MQVTMTTLVALTMVEVKARVATRVDQNHGSTVPTTRCARSWRPTRKQRRTRLRSSPFSVLSAALSPVSLVSRPRRMLVAPRVSSPLLLPLARQVLRPQCPRMLPLHPLLLVAAGEVPLASLPVRYAD